VTADDSAQPHIWVTIGGKRLDATAGGLENEDGEEVGSKSAIQWLCFRTDIFTRNFNASTPGPALPNSPFGCSKISLQATHHWRHLSSCDVLTCAGRAQRPSRRATEAAAAGGRPCAASPEDCPLQGGRLCPREGDGVAAYHGRAVMMPAAAAQQPIPRWRSNSNVKRRMPQSHQNFEELEAAVLPSPRPVFGKALACAHVPFAKDGRLV
jgi:hypothetical protein